MIKSTQFISIFEAEGLNPLLIKGSILVIISINDSMISQAGLQNGWVDVLRLYFQDIDRPLAHYKLFDRDQGKQVVDFVDKWHLNDQQITMVVHCHAGISRSAAIAKYISDIANIYFPKDYLLYNKHVYAILNELKFGKMVAGEIEDDDNTFNDEEF